MEYYYTHSYCPRQEANTTSHHVARSEHLLAVRSCAGVVDPTEGLFHGPDERDEVQRQLLVIQIARVVGEIVAIGAAVASSDRSAALLPLAEHKPAHRALPLALHPRHQAVVVEHVVAWRHQDLVGRQERLQANGAVLAVFLLRVVGAGVGPPAEEAALPRPTRGVGRAVHLLPELAHGLLELLGRQALVLRLRRLAEVPLAPDPRRRIPDELRQPGVHPVVGGSTEDQDSYRRMRPRREADERTHEVKSLLPGEKEESASKAVDVEILTSTAKTRHTGQKSREEEAVAAADTEVNAVEVGKEEDHHKPVLRRDPSFSRWCDVNGILRSNAAADAGSPETSSAAEESEEFELPLLHQGRSEEADAETEDQMRSQKSPISAVIVFKTLFYILGWYTFSTCLTVYNKTLLGDHLGKFPAPLLMNTVHFSMQAILSNAIVYIQSRISESNRNTMSWKDYFIRVIPTAIATALDVNLSNESLVFISVTFATMCKSASPIFLLVFAFVFRLETPSFKLLGIILIISAGVLLTVAKETEFEFWGFLFVMLSAVMSGFRWCMTQILLQKEAYGLKNPIALMSYVTPVMALITAVLSLLLDPWQKFKGNNYFNSSKHIMQSCLLMLLGGALAFFMVLTEYILVSATSAVTVTVAGIVKEALTIMVAVFYFHDQFTWLKGFGLFTIMVGVSLFNWYKYHKLMKGQQTENEGTYSRSIDRAAKYVILDDMELQDA
ncbi:unnamed protein product [Musa hybrid cultivar]